MERLTKKYSGGYGLVEVKDNEQEVDSPYPNTLQAILECFKRLGEYEDTELMPEEIEALKTNADSTYSIMVGVTKLCEELQAELERVTSERDTIKAAMQNWHEGEVE